MPCPALPLSLAQLENARQVRTQLAQTIEVRGLHLVRLARPSAVAGAPAPAYTVHAAPAVRPCGQANNENQELIKKATEIAVAGVVLSVLLAFVALVIGAVHIAKLKSVDAKWVCEWVGLLGRCCDRTAEQPPSVLPFRLRGAGTPSTSASNASLATANPPRRAKRRSDLTHACTFAKEPPRAGPGLACVSGGALLRATLTKCCSTNAHAWATWTCLHLRVQDRCAHHASSSIAFTRPSCQAHGRACRNLVSITTASKKSAARLS